LSLLVHQFPPPVDWLARQRAIHVTKVAVFGDAVPGGGTLAEFTARPLPSLNAAGHVASGS
jgi:hypothetical protein